MPLKKQPFTIVKDKLVQAVDVDDNRGRAVPANMNYIEEGYLAKDTGCSLHGVAETTLAHSLFVYKQKDGTKYIIRAFGTALQEYDDTAGTWGDITSSPVFTAGAEFGYIVYENELWLGNAVESLYKWDGTTFTAYATLPKGNIMEIFEDRLFISGVTAEPLTTYYSNAGVFATFTSTDVLKPLGTDHTTGLVNYFGSLLIFKEQSIWKLTFIYDQVVSLFIPKLESQNRNYGAISRKSISWVENDVWFFNGREVRSIGFKDQQIGVLGVNNSVLSEPIKETLAYLVSSNYSKVTSFYFNRRYYLSFPLTGTANNVTFVCHLLHGNNWTKYTDRIKSNANSYIEDDGVIYTTQSITPFGTLKWSDSLLNDNAVAIPANVTFKAVEDEDFSKFNIYRYLDILFKDLKARVVTTIKSDASDLRQTKEKTYIVGQDVEGEENALGEVPVGDLLIADSFGELRATSPFLKRRISFLSKVQSITIQLSNNQTDETFTVAQFALTGTKQPRKQFSTKNIISI
ncbi:hypothetical protein KAU11_08285 [Candidatus Babeliales bacterium]|nr:hypothetical protein [Candidatus Babeliales bacterium]